MLTVIFFEFYSSKIPCFEQIPNYAKFNNVEINDNRAVKAQWISTSFTTTIVEILEN